VTQRIELGNQLEGREQIRAHVLSLGSGARVIDIGGVAGGGWTAEFRTHCADINAPEGDGAYFRVDVCRRESWDQLLEWVRVNGLWDFAICTHTLEDLYNPIVALELLPRIARAGVIATPSARTELSHVESGGYLGNIHHHWLFYPRDGRVEIAPKLGLLERLAGDGLSFERHVEEQRVWWEGELNWCQFMNGYLGPSPDAVQSSFNHIINLARAQA